MDLVYIDPPFASGADYAKKVYLRRNPKVAEAIAQAEQELDIEELKAFEEKMYGDVWDKEKYLNWMYENLIAIKSVMSETASIYVHLDWHIGHYVKILLDEVFGESHFLNEVVWHYYNKMQGNVNRFASNHDVIFLYTKSDKYYGDGMLLIRPKIEIFQNLQDPDIALLLHQYASSCGCQSRFPAACSPMLMSSTALGGWIRASSYRHFHWTSRLIWPSSTPSTVSPSSMGLSFARMYDATL